MLSITPVHRSSSMVGAAGFEPATSAFQGPNASATPHPVMQKAHRRRVVRSDPSDDGPDTHHTNGSACREKPGHTRHNQTAIGDAPTFRCFLIMAPICHDWFLSCDSAVNPCSVRHDSARSKRSARSLVVFSLGLKMEIWTFVDYNELYRTKHN